MVFPEVTYSCESWTIRKAEHRRTDVFKLWCWRRLLKVPWTERSSNQSILKEINPEYSLEGDWCWSWSSSILVTWCKQPAHHWCNGHEFGQTLRDAEGQGGLACYSPWGPKESDTTGQPNNNSSIAGVQYYMLQVHNIGIHNLYKLFSIILHLWLLQNIGYIPHVVQYILEVSFILNNLYLLIPHPYSAPPHSPLPTSTLVGSL